MKISMCFNLSSLKVEDEMTTRIPTSRCVDEFFYLKKKKKKKKLEPLLSWTYERLRAGLEMLICTEHQQEGTCIKFLIEIDIFESCFITKLTWIYVESQKAFYSCLSFPLSFLKFLQVQIRRKGRTLSPLVKVKTL